ncbi:protein unc-13 [Sesamum angolense]|uniref:Protein unc-13 n=1 Tax=Sesamum angolense TaxID=2727404 RepID=A0AAE2BL24_9LAMI|nr:protein unc-13 [Sesamum angolense]
MEFSNPLLRRYRSDRRKLLEFLMSSGLIGKITTPAGPITPFSNIDFDAISIDYVLECVQSGGVLDVSEATKRYYFESAHPVMRHLQSGDVFYLHSDPRSAGSPPHRVPPSIITHQREFVESRNSQLSNPAGERSPLSSKQVTAAPDINGLHNASILSVGLLDDDMRESAYEVFLASMLFSGVEIHSTEGKKREKPSKFLAGLKNRRDKRQTERHIESESPERHFKISEAADTFIRRRLTQFATGKSCEPIDIPQLSLVLLTGVLRSDFPTFSSFQFLLAFLVNCNTSADGQEIYLPIVAHEEAMTGLQANVFEELVSSDDRNTEKQLIGTSLGKIRNAQEWDIKMSPSQRGDVLLTLRQVALAFSSIPGRFGVEGETYYWTTGYHLNVRLYEKLLCGVFDILEDGQLIEEAQEILKLMKLTWSMLGITERLHHALFAWVLFKQFVATEEAVLLDYAICEVERVLSAGVYDDKEVAYLKSLTCGTIGNGCEIRLNLLQSIFSSITSWCDSKLQDYHLHFSQKSSFFERVLTMGLSAGVQDFVPHGNNQFAGSCLPNEMAREKIGKYVEKSLDAACTRVTELTTIGSVKDKMHPLAVLASELRLIAEKDLSLFAPVLRSWYPRCAIVSAKTLHQFYGERLKPFLKDITCLTEDVRKVLPGAYALERCLIQLYSSACEENDSQYCQEFDHYPIAEISRSIILDWVVAQHDRILEWTGRAFDLEDWEPLSLQQKQAASAVEVFRIIEEVYFAITLEVLALKIGQESCLVHNSRSDFSALGPATGFNLMTVDQFFEWSLPMDITHLQALLSIIFHSLDNYLVKVVSQLGKLFQEVEKFLKIEKQSLYPPTPPLTRYKEATFPIVKKKAVESFIIDNEIYKQLDELTASKLCIRLNTFRYFQKQISALEDGIRKSWVSVTSYQTDRHCLQALTGKTSETSETTDVNAESVSELFVATLDCIRDSAANAIRKTSDFLGTKIVFWDMRDSFLYYLYHGGVEGNRLDGVLPQFDSVLNNICGLIDDTIRDLVVSNIWKASLEGFMWVLLDGGPSRAFSDTDITMIEEDFNMLKDLFVADGEGLPRSLVEEQAKFYHQILNLFSLKTESLIRMLMASSEHISVGVSSHKYGQRYLGDAQTLIRVLCHKKDREASMFLKTHYRLPSSSEYDDETAVEDSSFSSPLVSDIWKRSTSFRWSDKEASMSLNRTSYKHLQTGDKPLGPYAASEELYSSQVAWCRGKSRVSETGGMHGAICFGLITEIDLVSFTGFEKDQFMIIEFFVVD